MIVSLKKLAFDLGVDKVELRKVASRAGALYRSFDVRDVGATKWRHIDHPRDPLASIQRTILHRVLEKTELPSTMTGGLPGRSLFGHAGPHTAQPVVITLDLAHCFPSIQNKRVFELFRKRLAFSSDLAGLLTQLTTLRRRLPQGASSSPYLAALATEPMHLEILSFCAKRDLRFTQFVDDLAISGREGAQRFVPEIIGIVQRHGFGLSRPKVQVMRSSERQIVTGIVVNRGLSAGTQRISEIKDQIASYRDALFILAGETRSIDGKLAFVESLRPEQAERIRRFAAQCLPASADFPKTLASSAVERRSCTCTRKHEARVTAARPHVTPTVQFSLHGLGRRAFSSEAPPPNRGAETRLRAARQQHPPPQVGSSG